MEHAVRRAVVGADVLPRTAAHAGEERHLVEGVAGDVRAYLEAIPARGRQVERNRRRGRAQRDVLLRAVDDGRERRDRNTELRITSAAEHLRAVAVDPLPLAVRHERRDRGGGGLLGVVQGDDVLVAAVAVDA